MVLHPMQKCQFGIEEIDEYEKRFIKNGSDSSSEKIEAVKRSSSPESKEAAKSFLSITGYLPKFILRHASLNAFSQELTIKRQSKNGVKRMKHLRSANQA